MSSLSGMVAGFSAAEFCRDEFEPQEFVAMARRSVPLDELVKDLSSHLAELKMSLVDAINQDYAAFVGMASSLRGLDKALSRVRTPVESLRAEVQQIRDAAATAVGQVESKLDERHSLLKTQRRLTLLLDVEMGVQKLERLLDSAEPEKQETSDGKISTDDGIKCAAVLERVAHEFARLKGQVQRLDDDNSCGIRKVLAARVNSIEDSLMSRVNFLFAAGISASKADKPVGTVTGSSVDSKEVLEPCIRIYYTLDRADACESTIRQSAVDPFISEHITIAALEKGGPQGSCNGLSRIYEDVLDFVHNRCLPLASIAASALAGDKADVEADLDDVYEMLQTQSSNSVVSEGTNRKPFTWILMEPSFYIRCCVFPPLSTTLVSLGGKRLMNYRDEQLPSKYTCTMEFLSKLEVLCGTREGALALRRHTSFVDFLQKWDLPLKAYYQLQFQRVTDEVGPLLTSPQMLIQALEDERSKAQAAAPSPSTPGQPANVASDATTNPLPPSSTVSLRPPLPAAVDTATSAHVAGKESGFVLESSVVVWKSLVGVWGEGLGVMSQRWLQLSLLLLERYMVWAREWSEYLSKRLSAPPDRDSDSSNKRGEEELRLLGQLAADVELMCLYTRGELVRVVQEGVARRDMLEEHVEPCRSLIESTLTATAEGGQEVASGIDDVLVSMIAQRAIEPLTAVRAVTTQYRMTGKPRPNKPSLYVSGALLPIRTALAPPGALAWLSGAGRDKALEAIIERLWKRYLELVEELFSNVRKFGQTLKMLNKGGGGGGGEDGLSDEAKIFLQVKIDVEAMQADIASMLPTHTAPPTPESSLTRLVALVAAECPPNT